MIRPRSRNNSGNLQMKLVYRRITHFSEIKKNIKKGTSADFFYCFVVMRESRRVNQSWRVMLEKPGSAHSCEISCKTIGFLSLHTFQA